MGQQASPSTDKTMGTWAQRAAQVPAEISVSWVHGSPSSQDDGDGQAPAVIGIGEEAAESLVSAVHRM